MAAAAKKETKEKKAERKKQVDQSESKPKEKTKEEKKESNGRRTVAMIAFLVVVLIALIFILLSNFMLTVPFSTFKDNFDAAQHIAVVATYKNQAQYGYVAQCAIQLIQTTVHARNVSFYLINQTLCTYQEGVLGHISIKNDTPSNCLVSAKLYPTVFLNYSETNGTIITLDKLYVYGNGAYLSQCPIAVDLS